jgi:hypothetical protein
MVPLVPQEVGLDLRSGQLVVYPLRQCPHLIICHWRMWKLMHQFGRTCVHDNYGLTNTFHHSDRKFVASDIQPFVLEIRFGPSKFVSEQRYTLDEGGW